MSGRESAVDTAALIDWLSALLGTTLDPAAVTISRPSGGGWSNDTLFVDTGRSDPARLVVRLAPDGPAMFPTYDLGRQIAVMQAVAASGTVPVPPVLDTDPSGARLGRPAFVMGFVGGRVPVDDRPSFAESGFLFDAGESDQRTFHIGLLDAMAAVHAIAVPSALQALLGPGDRPSLVAAVDDLTTTWHFDRGERSSEVVEEALRALAAGVPAAVNDDVLLWGDARPANVIVAADGFRPVALLDWELATIGPPELELTWLAEMNRMRMQGSGVAPLPGFLGDDEAAAHYARRTGRMLSADPWYRLFAAVRVAVLMHRHLRVMVHVGRLPAEHRLLTRTIATDRVADLLGR